MANHIKKIERDTIIADARRSIQLGPHGEFIGDRQALVDEIAARHNISKDRAGLAVTTAILRVRGQMVRERNRREL